MVAIVSALCGDTPSFQATRAGMDRHPVLPQMPSWSISATISTRRPSIALRCPVNSAISSNNTARRFVGAKEVAAEDMPPS